MHTVETCFRDHLRGAHDYSGLLWKCLVLEIWLRHFEQGFQRPDARTNERPTVARAARGYQPQLRRKEVVAEAL